MKGAVRDWARPRRWSILAEAVLATAFAAVAVPVWALGGDEPEAVQVVTAYLEALRDGDVETAETYLSTGPGDGADTTWLTAEALSSDWEVAAVELKSASESTVHATIASAGRRADGAFVLEGAEGDLKIANPYTYLSVTTTLLPTLEINGVTGPAAPDQEGGQRRIALYPGVYRLFEGVPGLGGGDGPVLMSLPGSSDFDDTADLVEVLSGRLSGNEAVEARLNEALAAWVDECAATAEAAPQDCPFSAASSWGGTALDDGRNEFGEVAALDWAVHSYPEVRLAPDLRLEVVQPGLMTLTGTGTPEYEDGPTEIDGLCDIVVGRPAVGEDGEVSFTIEGELQNTCY